MKEKLICAISMSLAAIIVTYIVEQFKIPLPLNWNSCYFYVGGFIMGMFDKELNLVWRRLIHLRKS